MNKEDYFKYYIQGSDHYLIPKDVFDELFDEMNNWKEEAKELKKQLEAGEEQYNDLVEENEKLQEQLSSITLQLEEYKEQVNKGLYNTCLPYTTGYNKAIKDKEIQQKEFIEYLEEEMKKNINWYNSLTPHDKNYYYKDYVDKDTNYRVVLSKYKEIIGVSNENNMGNTK